MPTTPHYKIDITQRMHTALNNIGLRIRRRIIARHALQIDPSGKPWTPLNEKYKKYKAKTGYSPLILLKSGDMINKTVHEVNGMGLKIAANKVGYPNIHQEGGDKIPQRMWMDTNNEDKVETDIVNEELDSAASDLIESTWDGWH